MKIKNNTETLKACRYCSMCRHVCTSGNISYHESDYPRGRALILDKILEGRIEYLPDLVDTIYNCCLCGVCWANCEGEFKPHEFMKSARMDIVDQDKIPQEVSELTGRLMEGRNPYQGPDKIFKGKEEQAEVLYYMGDFIKFNDHSIADSVLSILEKAGIKHTILESEPSDGRILSLLGFRDEAKKKAVELHQRITDLDPGIILVSDPVSYDGFKNEFPSFGLELKPEVLHISEYIDRLLDKKRLKLKPVSKKITIADSEFLGRFNKIFDAPRKVVKAAAGNNMIEMKKSREKALATGEAAFIFNGEISGMGDILGSKICKEARDAGAQILITLSGIAKSSLKKCKELDVFEISEFICQNMI